MRLTTISLLFLLAFTPKAYGQRTLDYADLIKQFTGSMFFEMHQNHERILLSEIIDTSTFYYIKRILSVDTFYKRITYDGGKTVTTERFVVTRDERKFIDSFYFSLKTFFWTSELINATILTVDTVRSIYKQPGDIGNYLSLHYGDRRLFALSKPIFLRNNSICIFYKQNDCGVLCGGGTLAIYKKENAKWNPYMILADWIE